MGAAGDPLTALRIRIDFHQVSWASADFLPILEFGCDLLECLFDPGLTSQFLVIEPDDPDIFIGERLDAFGRFDRAFAMPRLAVNLDDGPHAELNDDKIRLHTSNGRLVYEDRQRSDEIPGSVERLEKVDFDLRPEIKTPVFQLGRVRTMRAALIVDAVLDLRDPETLFDAEATSGKMLNPMDPNIGRSRSARRLADEFMSGRRAVSTNFWNCSSG